MIVLTNFPTACEENEVIAEEWVSKTMQLVMQEKAKADEAVRALFGTGHVIDEMSVLFTAPERAHTWVSAAVRIPGVVLFNTAHDQVQTAPIRSDYSVHYWFLSSPFAEGYEPGEERWRIEAMYAHPGSPLHDSIMKPLRAAECDGGVMHASFKCDTEEEYANANRVLQDNGYECAQRCQSTYGRFGYWYPLDAHHDAVITALKPRVNLRDKDDDDE